MKKKPNGYWTYERVVEEAKKYETIMDFRNNSVYAYDVAKKNKWLDKLPLKRLKTKDGTWTVYETVYNEAKKYKTITIKFIH